MWHISGSILTFPASVGHFSKGEIKVIPKKVSHALPKFLNKVRNNRTAPPKDVETVLKTGGVCF